MPDLRLLPEICSRYAGIQTLYVFGSVGGGRTHKESDLDLAWVRMLGFRDDLVHDYADIDRRIVYQVLQQRPGDLDALGRAFAQFP